MKYAVFLYVAFYAMIGVACWATQSAWPLCALIFTPSYGSKGDKKDKLEP